MGSKTGAHGPRALAAKKAKADTTRRLNRAASLITAARFQVEEAAKNAHLVSKDLKEELAMITRDLKDLHMEVECIAEEP